MTNTSIQFIKKLDCVYTQILSSTLEHAKKCFIDYLAVSISGSKTLRQELYDQVNSSNGSSFVFGTKKRSEVSCAICLNAYAAHVLELDDGHRAGMMHLAAPIFSSLLPVAEIYQSTLKEFLMAAVIGYEAAIRIAKTIQPEHKRRGFHCTGTCGTIGSAMSIAYLLNYSFQEKLNVLSASCTSAAGLLEVIMGQSQQKPYNISHAALAGYTAATFGKNLSGPNDILTGKRGFLNNFCDNPKLDKLLGEGVPEIIGGYFKPYAACRHCHAPIEAALELREKGIEPTIIERVVVSTYDLAVYGHDHRTVDSINSAKMSTPYGVAIALIYGNAGMEMYTESYIQDFAIHDMMNKISVEESLELSALVPNKRAASIDVYCKNGMCYSKRVDFALGEPENPVSIEDILKKFDSLLMATMHEREYVTNLHCYLNTLEDSTTIIKILSKI